MNLPCELFPEKGIYHLSTYTNICEFILISYVSLLLIIRIFESLTIDYHVYSKAKLP